VERLGRIVPDPAFRYSQDAGCLVCRVDNISLAVMSGAKGLLLMLILPMDFVSEVSGVFSTERALLRDLTAGNSIIRIEHWQSGLFFSQKLSCG
jgi:hypothetical protein